MHMVKHNADPINAMIRSKDGTRIAMIVMMMTVSIRIPSFSKPREKPDMPTIPVELDRARTSSPAAISTVLMIGRALNSSVKVPFSVEVGALASKGV